jgi:hypothetical protein
MVVELDTVAASSATVVAPGELLLEVTKAPELAAIPVTAEVQSTPAVPVRATAVVALVAIGLGLPAAESEF